MKTRRSQTGAGEEEVFSTPARNFPDSVTSPHRLTRGAMRRLSNGVNELYFTPPQTLPSPSHSPESTQLSRGVKRPLDMDLRTPSPKRSRAPPAEEIDIRTPPEELELRTPPKEKRLRPSTGIVVRGAAKIAHEPRKLEHVFESPESVANLPGLDSLGEKSLRTKRKDRDSLPQSEGSPASTVTTASVHSQRRGRNQGRFPNPARNPSPNRFPTPSKGFSQSASVTADFNYSSPEKAVDARRSRRLSLATVDRPCVKPPPLAQLGRHADSAFCSPPRSLPASGTNTASFMTPPPTKRKSKNADSLGGGVVSPGSVLCTPPKTATAFQDCLDQVASMEGSLGAEELRGLAGSREEAELGYSKGLELAQFTEDAELEQEEAVTRAQLPDRWSPLDPVCVEAARSAVHPSTAPAQVTCRDRERTQIFDFLKSGVRNRTAGSMYVCGLPGTGKTLALSEAQGMLRTWATEENLPTPHLVSINCMTLRDPKEVYDKVLQEVEVLNEKAVPASTGRPVKRAPSSKLASASAQLQRALSGAAGGETKTPKPSERERGMVLVILDEMDRLISRDQTVLYEMFKLATAPGSRCLLVGIANAIDLTERFLPKLRLMNCFPQLVTFPAYEAPHIKSILTQRLSGLPFTAFEPMTLEMCARKVAAASGDMRKALGVCRLALSLAVAEAQQAAAACAAAVGPVVAAAPSTPSPTKRLPSAATRPSVSPNSLGTLRSPGVPFPSPVRNSVSSERCESVSGLENEARGVRSDGNAGPSGRERVTIRSPSGEDVPVEKWTVGLGHMAEALSQSFTLPVIQGIQNLPQHHQMVLCAAVLLFRKKRKDALLGELQKAYCQLCQRTVLRPLTLREFVDSCDVLVAQALLVIGSAKEQKHRRVTMRVHEDDVTFALQGVRFFRNLLTPA